MKVGGVLGNRGDVPHPPPFPLLNRPSAILSSAGGASEIDRPFLFVIYIVIVFSSRSADVMRSGALADTTAALRMRVKKTE